MKVLNLALLNRHQYDNVLIEGTTTQDQSMLTHPEASAVQVWESEEVPRLSGDCEGKCQGWHAERCVVKKDPCRGQALCCRAPLDHDQVQCCQEVV